MTVCIVALARGEGWFPVFFGTWVVLAAFGLWFFRRSKDVEARRQAWPWWGASVGVLFLFFVYLTGFDLGVVAAFAPAVAGIWWLNVRNTAFCGSCGKQVFSRSFTRPKHCENCGSSLTA